MEDESPPPELAKLKRRRKGWLITMCTSGILIILPLIAGLGGTVAGMIRAFDRMGTSGEPDPEKLAGDISVALLTTAGGLVVSLFFLLLFVVSLVCWLVSCSAVTNFQRPSGS